MALLQVKFHGEVSDHKVRSMDAAYTMRNELHTEVTVRRGYTLVGSAPNLNMYVCPEHLHNASPDDDFCYIIGISSGRVKAGAR